MFKKLVLFFLFCVSLLNKSDLQASSESDVSRAAQVILTVAIGFPVIAFSVMKFLQRFFPTHPGGHGNTKVELLSKNDQRFAGELPQYFQDLIELLKKIPPVGNESRWKFWAPSVSAINPELKNLLYKGILIHGAPGCGKNFLWQEFINQLQNHESTKDIPCVSVTGGIDTGFVGGGIANWQKAIKIIGALAEKSEKRIGFLVFNECEALFANRLSIRSNSDSLGTILDTIDGF